MFRLLKDTDIRTFRMDALDESELAQWQGGNASRADPSYHDPDCAGRSLWVWNNEYSDERGKEGEVRNTQQIGE